jgi:transcriptional regulator with XRE-family HTH domain
MKALEQNLDSSIGRQIHLQRVKKEMSVQQLAEAIGMTAQDISDYEAGRRRPPPDQLFDIATTLDVTIGYLFSSMLGGHGRTDTTDGS